jgi:hypothetical protein
VNDFAIARAGVHAEVALAFENDHFPAAKGQRPGYTQANDSRADHNAIDAVQRTAYARGLIAAAAATNSSTSALKVAKQVTKRMVTPGGGWRSGQR